MRYLSPTDIQELFSIKRTTAYELLKEYEEKGNEVIRIGKLRRVPEDSFVTYLKERSKSGSHKQSQHSLSESYLVLSTPAPSTHIPNLLPNPLNLKFNTSMSRANRK